MERSFVVLCLCALGCGSAPLISPDARAASAARVLDPGCGGSRYTSVQAAIDAADDGDVVELCAGTYAERLVISGKRLTLRSVSGAEATVIDAEGLGVGLTLSGGAEVTVERLTFLHGYSGGDGGNVSCLGSTLTLSDSRLATGSARRGGGLAATACTGSVTGTTIEGNSAWAGGGAWIQGDLLRFERNVVRANYSDLTGGGVHLAGSSPLVDNTLEANGSGLYGGGAYVLFGSGEVIGNYVAFNTSMNDGAGIYLDHGEARVDGNTFEGNDSSDEGGGLRVKLSSATITYNVFTANHADYRGGGAKVSHDEVVMIGNVFTSNTAWSAAGGLLLEESASRLTGNTFALNTADNGGGLSIVDGWGAVVIEDGSFVDNQADLAGGHIYIDLLGFRTVLRRVELTGGEASTGGAIYAVGTDVHLASSLLSSNRASVAGGGLYLEASTADVRNTVFYANDAVTGAGIGVANSLSTRLVNTVFAQNTGGAAVGLEAGVPPSVSYCGFDANASDFSGMTSALGASGNASVLAGFTDPAGDDFTLLGSSPLIDAGDPAILDADGTRSDMGMHGGPDAP